MRNQWSASILQIVDADSKVQHNAVYGLAFLVIWIAYMPNFSSARPSSAVMENTHTEASTRGALSRTAATWAESFSPVKEMLIALIF